MTWSSIRRRWPELALIPVLLAAVLVLDGTWRAVAALALAGVVVFTVRRRPKDLLRGAAILLVLLVASAVLTVTIDLGPIVRGVAERYGSRLMINKLHIGRLGIHLASGKIVVEDILIDSRRAGEKPFFTAKSVRVGVPWWRVLFTRDLPIESVELDQWEMLIEKWPEFGSTFPRVSGDPTSLPKPKGGKKLYTTTLKYLHAGRGKFSYFDHGTWNTTNPNLDLVIRRASGEYVGQGSSSNGVVQVEGYEPMRSDIRFSFKLDGPIVNFDSIHLHTDGSSSSITGKADLGNWPEMTYYIVSNQDLATMRQVWWKNETWRMAGLSDFAGTFHLFKGGFEVKGAFHTDHLKWQRYDFENLNGFLRWQPNNFEITGGQTGMYDGRARFMFTIGPLGNKKTRAQAHFDAYYENVDLTKFSVGTGMVGVRMVGTATGHNLLEWPSGHYGEHRGHGEMVLTPPAGTEILTRQEQPRERAIHEEEVMAGPERNMALFPYPMVIGGTFDYRFGPEWFEVLPSHLATPRTYVEFSGTTEYGQNTEMPLYARSADWQESDRVLAGVLTAFGSPTSVVKIGGWGEFTGTMRKTFSSPLVEGYFAGGGLRSWDVVWGEGTAKVAIENGYADVTGGVVRKDGSQITANGRFSLGYPRKDKGEEINARVEIKDRDLKDLRHAFIMDDWPVNGTMSGEYHLYGAYTGPYGYGGFTIRDGNAWKEPFDLATATLRFEGAGVRVDGFNLKKSTGTINGAAWIEWAGRYSFNGDGHAIPMESVQMANWPQLPVSGRLQFTANGAGTFGHPHYDAKFQIDDLFAKDEGVGQVTGDVGMRDTLVEARFEAASPRLALSGTAQVELTPVYDAEITLRFSNTSLDPYLRIVQPGLSPFARAVAGGSVHVMGQLYNPEQLLVETQVDSLDLNLFDYTLTTAKDPVTGKDRPIKVDFDRNVVRLRDVHLEGRDTKLALTGWADIPNDRINVNVTGDADLGILQAFFRDMRSSGRATLSADIQGPIAKPVLSGSASIKDGRIRAFGLPNSLQALNGRLTFDANGLRLEDMKGQFANGRVSFGGRIELNGYKPSQLALTANGEGVELRYPEGFRSVLDADLALVGPLSLPTLRGSVTVRSAVLRRQLNSDFLGLAGLAGAGGAIGGGGGSAASLPLKLDLHVTAQSALRVETNVVHLVSSAALTVRGDLSHPVVLGRADVDRGEAIISGKRYVVTHGTIDFNNPTKIEPYFDLEAETRVRAPGQTYQVNVRLAGTPNRIDPQFNSDPPLPQVEVLSLLFGDATRAPEAELGTFRRTEMQGSLATQQVQNALTGLVSGNVTRAVEQAFGLDTFQITPALFDPYQRNLNPGARVTVGKRISDKIYLTFSRSLNNTPGGDQVILLEFDQSDRLSWVLSRNEDATYALDVRVRHVF